MSNVKGTNVPVFIADLNGGIVERQLALMLSDAAAAVVEHGGKGKVTVVINMQRIGNTNQVELPITLTYSQPTATGKRSEDISSTSIMHLGREGLTLFPEDQGQMFTKTGEVAQHS